MEKTDKCVSIIASVLAIFTAIPTVITVIKEEYAYALVWGIALCLAILVAVAFVVKSLVFKHDSLFYRKLVFISTHKGKYILNKRETFYEFVDREHMNHSKKFEVYTLVDGVDTFTDRYVYSGETRCKVNPLISNQTIVGEFKDLGVNFYSIKAARPSPKRKVMHFGMKMDPIEDLQHKSKPFLSTGIYEATKFLKMEVKFGTGLIPNDAKLYIYKNYIDQQPVKQENLVFDANSKSITYEIKYPIYGYKYVICWNFDS